MTIEKVREAIEKRDIDTVLSLAKNIEIEDIDDAVRIYERFHEKETRIRQAIDDILARTKILKSKNKIPVEGSYSYRLEK